MTDRQIKGMKGTEFKYNMGVDSIPAVIVEADPAFGYTAVATSNKSEKGVDVKDGQEVLCHNHALGNTREEMVGDFEEILSTGEYKTKSFTSFGMQDCAFL